MGDLFVIAEIEPTSDSYVHGSREYHLVDRPEDERVWLRVDSPALVRKGQLRYGYPERGDRILRPDGLTIADHNMECIYPIPLIIDPPAPVKEKSELEKWADECPLNTTHGGFDDYWFGLGKLREWWQRRPK